MALVRIANFLVAAIASAVAAASSGCGRVKSAAGPTAVTTCALHDSGTKYDGAPVAVHGVIRTDLMHFQNVESPGCADRPVAMFFSPGSQVDPCGDSEFAKAHQCPLNAAGWRIEATFIGTYHSEKRQLEVTDLQGFKRIKAEHLGS